MVSMKDIAKKCGVSIATVSKALNGQKDIGEETRKRICAVAEEMGYMANSVARALKTNRSYNLGMLLVDERRSGLGHEYFSTIIEGFKAEAESHGYDGINLARMMRLTTYTQNAYTIGKTAADRLISRIEHPEDFLPERIVVSGELMEGTSVHDINI